MGVIKGIFIIILGFLALSCVIAEQKAPKGEKYPFYIWFTIIIAAAFLIAL